MQQKEQINLSKAGKLALTALMMVPAAQSFSQEGARQLDEIVVTARRREESLQDIPVAVTAFSPEVMKARSITDAYDLVGNVPGLMVQGGSATRQDVQYWIRGQGQTFGANPSVVQYYAEVPIDPNSAGGGSNLAFFDIENIQVLKGPQGTLFGRPTTGGAVLVQPARPTHEFGGFVEAGMGDYSARNITAALNVPLIQDVLALRVAYNSDKHDGYTKNYITGQRLDDNDAETYRISVLFEPTNWLSNYTMFQDNKINSNGGAIQPVWVNQNFQLVPGVPVKFIPGISDIYASMAAEAERIGNGTNDGVRRYNSPHRNFINAQTQLVINTTEFDLGEIGPLGEVSLKNIFSTDRVLKNFVARDLVGGGDFYHTWNAMDVYCETNTVCGPNDKVSGYIENTGRSYASSDFMAHYTNEFQIAGTINGVHDWQVGYYYERDKDTRYLNGTPSGEIFGGEASANSGFTKGYLWEMQAFYGQTTLDLGEFGLDNFKLTLGYRDTDFKEKLTDVGVIITDQGLVPDPNPNNHYSGKTSQSGESYTLSLDWQATDDMLFYVAHRKGFKQGGINLQGIRWIGFPGVVADSDFQPEKTKDYEFGAKLDWALGDIYGRSNLAIFTQENTNVQQNTTFLNGNGSTC